MHAGLSLMMKDFNAGDNLSGVLDKQDVDLLCLVEYKVYFPGQNDTTFHYTDIRHGHSLLRILYYKN